MHYLKWDTLYICLACTGYSKRIGLYYNLQNVGVYQTLRTIWENDPNKSRGYEGLSFGDLELDLELDLKGQH